MVSASGVRGVRVIVRPIIHFSLDVWRAPGGVVQVCRKHNNRNEFFRGIVLGVRELLKVPNQRCLSLVSILVGNLISELI